MKPLKVALLWSAIFVLLTTLGWVFTLPGVIQLILFVSGEIWIARHRRLVQTEAVTVEPDRRRVA